MLSTFLPFYLLPPVTKFRGVFGGRKLFLPGHFGLIFDGRVETAITSRTPRPSAARVANKNTGSQSCSDQPAPPRHRPDAATGTTSRRWRGRPTRRDRDVLALDHTESGASDGIGRVGRRRRGRERLRRGGAGGLPAIDTSAPRSAGTTRRPSHVRCNGHVFALRIGHP